MAAQDTINFYRDNPEVGRPYFHAMTEDELKGIRLADGPDSPRLRLFPDDFPLFAEFFPDLEPEPNPDDYDANGVGPADADGYRQIRSFDTYVVKRINDAIQSGNGRAEDGAQAFARKLMWNADQPEYMDPHAKAVVQLMFDNPIGDSSAMVKAMWLGDYEYAVAGPVIDPAAQIPYTPSSLVRGPDGARLTYFRPDPVRGDVYGLATKLVLIDSIDEEQGRRLSNDAISAERASEIAREALDLYLETLGLAPWEGPWGS